MTGLCFDCDALAHRLKHPQPVEGCDWCRISSIHLGFGGYQQQFHDYTVGEWRREHEEHAKREGYEVVPAGDKGRWI